MIAKLFDRRPNPEAEAYADAQALIDDGLDRDFVLSLFGPEAEWLDPLLETGEVARTEFEADTPSYYFEASLKNRFLEAGRSLGSRPTRAAPAWQPLRTAAASLAVMGAATAVGVVTLGFVTAGDSVPGDWNYAFKLANERMEYSLSSGNGRVDIQLGQTEARVYEIQRLSSRGELHAGDLEKLEREARALTELTRETVLDEVQKARLSSLGQISVAVLSDVSQKQSELDPAARSAASTVSTAVAAGLGGATAITPPATPSPEPTPTANPTESATPAP